MVKTKHGDFDVRPITFGERRELHRLEMYLYEGENINKEAYFNLLDWVMNKAFVDPEKSLEKLDDAAIDEVLNEIYIYYKELSQKKILK